MQDIEIEKIVFNCGGTEDKLEKSIRLLEAITKKKVMVIKSTRRLPAFGISPGKKSGCKVTIRNQDEIKNLLTRIFASFDNKIKKKRIAENHLSVGIPEYIEVPGMEYQRDIGILGFEVSIVFTKKGKRVKLKKIRKGKYPKKQNVTKEEITEYLKKNLGAEIV